MIANLLYDRALTAVHKTLFIESNLVGRVNDLPIYASTNVMVYLSVVEISSYEVSRQYNALFRDVNEATATTFKAKA